MLSFCGMLIFFLRILWIRGLNIMFLEGEYVTVIFIILKSIDVMLCYAMLCYAMCFIHSFVVSSYSP